MYLHLFASSCSQLLHDTHRARGKLLSIARIKGRDFFSSCIHTCVVLVLNLGFFSVSISFYIVKNEKKKEFFSSSIGRSPFLYSVLST